VYPVPKAAEYENRLLGPYRAALPCAAGRAPELFAIPGSHDWYDGLVNFTSIFCRKRWIGGWRTRQRRSYFAIKLPHRWWLWGIDIQFGSYIDEAQLRYFAGVALNEMQPGDRIILCMAKEVDSGRKDAEVHSDRDIEFLEREIIQPCGARLLLSLKSGKHYYARYEWEEGCRQHIASGGGGAFLHPTHNLPVQVLLALMLGLHLGHRHVALGLGDLRHALWESPTFFLFVLFVTVFVIGMVRFAHDARGVRRFLVGMIHSTLQLAGSAGVMIVASWLSTAGGLQGEWSLVAFLGVLFVVGGIGGMVGMSGYLWTANCFGLHGTEGYAAQHHQDLKHFIRLHIGADGALTVYPVGVDRVGRKWTLCPDAPAHAPWFAPAGAEPEPHLIEKPITITGKPYAH